MEEEKKKKLEAAGWTVGSAEQFLENKSTDPADFGPCFDGCMCVSCWKGWTTIPREERAAGRIDQVYQDVENGQISRTLASVQIREVLKWFLEES